MPLNGHEHDAPLHRHTETAVTAYLASLNGHRPARLYALVMREVEAPLFKAVMNFAEGNQCRAAEVLGISRGTLRKKLKEYGLDA
ncbi:MAG: DNA-binding protein [Steroidobacteraceae bacterium]|nr:DNA-binding protein [Steroidobacteraceae bacterium]